MKVLETSDRQLAFSRARREMIRALAILDQLDAPGEVASHLDLAICRLEQHLGMNTRTNDGAGALYATLEEELLSSEPIDELQCLWNQSDVAQCQAETAPFDPDPG